MQFRSESFEVKKCAVSRRDFGKTLAAGVLSIIAQTAPFAFAETGAKNSPTSSGDDLTFRSAAELAQLVREQKISSEELVRAHLKRIQNVNPRLNAVVQLDADRAVREAKAADASNAHGKILGPLHGVPVTVKDSLDTAGIVTTAGTMGRAHYIPKQDATAVARLRAAGAIIVGKTNTPELTLSYETDNLIYGRTNNPYDLARTPGGSSGGAAAIIAAGGSPLDIGSDTAGSLRVPSHFCGIATLKPTYGRVSRAGNIFGPGGVIGRQTHIGPMARYVEDLILLLPILSGPDSRDPDVVPAYTEDSKSVDFKTLKAAYFTAYDKDPIAADIDKTIRNVARAIADAGVTTLEKVPPGFTEAESILRFLNSGDGGDYYQKIVRRAGTTQLSPKVADILDRTRSGVISGRKYSDVLLDWSRFRETALDFMSDFDILICPVASATAPLHGGTDAIDFSFSYYFNLLGWPAAVVRAGADTSGLPIGVQIVGRPWADHQVLAVAQHIERALGGYKRDFPEKPLLASTAQQKPA